MINGTRVTVRTVPASLAEGAKIKEILADFPTIPGRKRVGRHRVCRGVLRRKGYSVIVTEIRRSEARAGRSPIDVLRNLLRPQHFHRRPSES